VDARAVYDGRPVITEKQAAAGCGHVMRWFCAQMASWDNSDCSLPIGPASMHGLYAHLEMDTQGPRHPQAPPGTPRHPGPQAPSDAARALDREQPVGPLQKCSPLPTTSTCTHKCACMHTHVCIHTQSPAPRGVHMCTGKCPCLHKCASQPDRCPPLICRGTWPNRPCCKPQLAQAHSLVCLVACSSLRS